MYIYINKGKIMTMTTHYKQGVAILETIGNLSALLNRIYGNND